MREVNWGVAGKCNFWFHTRVPDVDLISLSPPGVGCHVTRGSNSFLWSVGASSSLSHRWKVFFNEREVKVGEKFVSENKMKSHAHYRTLAQPVKVKNINSQLTDDFLEQKKLFWFRSKQSIVDWAFHFYLFIGKRSNLVCIFYQFENVIFANY